METVHCHSSFTSDLLVGAVICDKVLPQSLQGLEIAFSVWVFFYKSTWLPSASKHRGFSRWRRSAGLLGGCRLAVVISPRLQDGLFTTS